MSPAPGRLLRAGQRLVVSTAGGRARRVWAVGYRLAARVVARILVRGEEGASLYVRAGAAGGDFVPGLSDIDLAIVLEPDPAGPGIAAERIRQRFTSISRKLPAVGSLFDVPCAYDEGELADLVGSSYATFGLADTTASGGAAYLPDPSLLDRRRILERPGLYDDLPDWTRLAGPDRMPLVTDRDARAQPIAAWLELAFWWRFAFAACLDPKPRHTAFLCFKLVAEPARAWLWLAHGERPRTRRDVLERALELLPQEATVILVALDLERRLQTFPEPPLSDVLPALVRFSTRIARLVADRSFAEGGRSVRLMGASPPELLPARSAAGSAASPFPHPADALPLCDWRALAVPTHADESFLRCAGDPGDPADVAAAARKREGGTYRVLCAEEVILFPTAVLERPLPRNVACAASDPVSFALLGGRVTALFPNAPGWSIEDTARRAVAEHRARLVRISRSGDDLSTLVVLLTAARAALVRESLDHDPVVPVTLTATADLLGERSAPARALADEVIHRLREDTIPDPAAIDALYGLVTGLRGYRAV